MTDCCETYVHGMAPRAMAQGRRPLAGASSPETAKAGGKDELVIPAVDAEKTAELLAADTDREEIRLTLSGDETAYARIVGRYETQIFAQMWRFSRDRRILDELVQDVFVEAYRNLAQFRSQAPFLHWLRRIATRVGYRHWKHENRDRNRRLLLRQHAFIQGMHGRLSTPSDAAEVMFDMLAQLAPKDRLVLTLYYLEDYDTKQIAEQTGWNTTLVRVRIHRACRRLRRLLMEAGYE